MIHSLIAGKTFLEWRRSLLLKGGRKVDLDWLLDIAGGVSWSKLQNIIINPDLYISLEIPILLDNLIGLVRSNINIS